jgi:hypothetical protein
MNPERAKNLIEKQREQIAALKQHERYSDAHKKWLRDTEVALEHIFGKDSRHKSDFAAISYSLSIFTTSTPDCEFVRAYHRGLDEANSILESMIEEIEEYGFGNEGAWQPDTLSIVENLCNRFHLTARQLRVRHDSRKTLEIEDEYDTQDLLHALLRLNFNDIREEEYNPSYAGSASRSDFLLKEEEIIIEVKKTRRGLDAKKVGEELIIDISRYKVHPNCKCLVCFVYDPEGRIGNPRGLENDLSSTDGKFIVRVIVAPKNI